MLFCSREYLLFFVMIFTLYWVMPWARARVWLLLFASFYFYASWNKWLAVLICISTVADYFMALGIDRWTQPRVRRSLLFLSISANLCLLGYFKYANFFLESLEEGLRAAGASASLPLLQVILPVGISFYTFEAINYVVDVYRRKAPAERNLAHFMLFITFFPHLVAGPIVRAKDFLPQIRRPKHWDWARVQLGVEYFLMGLVKKLAVADRMALFVDPVFENPSAYQSHTVWLAVFAYALQIYCDFSGYTDMAIGSAHLLGYKLAPNFNMPLLSSNFSEFWRRWHISLSTWLRDYLFIPLGGSQGSRWRTCLNLLITMTLAGLWHGANWNFVVFGILHGVLMGGHRIFRGFAENRPRLDGVLNTRLGNACCVALTFLTFCLTLVVFRGGSFDRIGVLFQHMLIPTAGLGTPMPAAGLVYTYVLVGLCHWIAYQSWFKYGLRRVPAEAVGLGYCCILMAALLMAPTSGQAFIYFQF